LPSPPASSSNCWFSWTSTALQASAEPLIYTHL
jgi:hypothetical protein